VSMPAMPFDSDVVVDPDDLKSPERAAHRRAVDVVALAATRLLGPDFRVFCDLNWYPNDDAGAMAPDVMVLPSAAVEASPRSYRQAQPDGEAPIVVVEVPSDGDSFAAFRAKAFRYRDLGSVAYIVVVDGPRHTVLRLGPDNTEPVLWIDKPIPELGGLSLGFDDKTLVVTTPTGAQAASADGLLAIAEQRAEAERGRVEVLEAQLRALGAEPQPMDSGRSS